VTFFGPARRAAALRRGCRSRELQAGSCGRHSVPLFSPIALLGALGVHSRWGQCVLTNVHLLGRACPSGRSRPPPVRLPSQTNPTCICVSVSCTILQEPRLSHCGAIRRYGPKDLPRIARMGGQYAGKFMVFVRKTRSGMDSFATQNELLHLYAFQDNPQCGVPFHDKSSHRETAALTIRRVPATQAAGCTPWADGAELHPRRDSGGADCGTKDVRHGTSPCCHAARATRYFRGQKNSDDGKVIVTESNPRVVRYAATVLLLLPSCDDAVLVVAKLLRLYSASDTPQRAGNSKLPHISGTRATISNPRGAAGTQS
jgi:hypothetical protein